MSYPHNPLDRLYADVKRSLELEDFIRRRIRAEGALSFAGFMKMALYHDPLGYYRANTDATTRSGDFLTSPETHPLFGELLARFAIATADAMDDPAFTVVEQGAGTGALADSFTEHVRANRPGLQIRYVIVEPYAWARARLQNRLGDRATIVADIREIGPFTGVYLSNELPDAFPVRRVRRVGDEMREIFVTLDGDSLIEIEEPLSSPDVSCWLEAAGIELADGAEIEVSLELERWITGVAEAMERGIVLTIDYGYEAGEAAKHPRGTLLAHYHHTVNEDYLQRIGMQDLTSHVCWTALERLGERAGLHTMERLTQREFLIRWGWKEYGRKLLAEGADPVELDAVDRLGRVEDGLGGFGVLVQGKRLSEPIPPSR